MKFYGVLLAFLCLTMSSSSSAQAVRRARAQITITDVAGKVVDEAGAAVAEATVTLVNETTHEERTTRTDASGEFIFHGVSLGSYRLRAVMGRLASLQTEVELSTEPRNPMTLKLLPVRAAARAARPPESPQALPAPPPPATMAMAAEPNYYTVKVFYATDRKATGQTAPANFYGSDRDPNANEILSLGTCEVSIPRDHQRGELEAPSIWKLEFREDPEKHVVLLGVHPETRNQFFGELANTVASSENKDAFVFIHGYKTTFRDAARRTAQLAYDLNFHGAPILYSWPSKGDLDGYSADEGTIIWTTPHLKAFLRQVALQSNARTVHLIAHSMGNRALTQALADLAASPGGTAQPQLHFREVILAAPDVDRDVFEQLADAISKTADRVTLYASSHDEALAASKRLHEGPRAGEAGQGLLVMKGIDTIDVSTVDTSFLGHSYFGDNTSVISDIQRLLKEGFPPGQRACLSEAFSSNLAYWIFLRTSCPAN
jgi:esterase/lipase superfamily enzyme